LDKLSSLNSSIQAHRVMILGIAIKTPALNRSSYWVDVRDVALAHVEAAYIRPEASNKRFIVCSPEKSNFQREAEIIREAFPEWAQGLVLPPNDPPKTHITIDGSPLTRELGIKYTSLKDCMIALAKQLHDQAVKEGLLTS
jgi:nucleoside-diphosphate-sugar epimerase